MAHHRPGSKELLERERPVVSMATEFAPAPHSCTLTSVLVPGRPVWNAGSSFPGQTTPTARVDAGNRVVSLAEEMNFVEQLV